MRWPARGRGLGSSRRDRARRLLLACRRSWRVGDVRRRGRRWTTCLRRPARGGGRGSCRRYRAGLLLLACRWGVDRNVWRRRQRWTHCARGRGRGSSRRHRARLRLLVCQGYWRIDCHIGRQRQLILGIDSHVPRLGRLRWRRCERDISVLLEARAKVGSAIRRTVWVVLAVDRMTGSRRRFEQVAT